METQTATAKRGTHKDVYTILTEQVIEKLKKGIVPWQVSWTKAGIPENVISGNAYRGINRVLLASLGCDRNLFLTSKQLKTLDGAILPEEKPHIISYLSDSGNGAQTEDATSEPNDGNKQMKLQYYTVFNIAQCRWAADKVFPEVNAELDPIQKSVAYKSKDQKRSYYDPLQDFINMPSEKNFPTKESYCLAEFHQLMHSTGHHSRLNRKDLIQMSEFGYDSFSHEELVAEIGTFYLMSHYGLASGFEITPEYLNGWIARFERDRYMLFSAASQAEKAINFLFIGEVDKADSSADM